MRFIDFMPDNKRLANFINLLSLNRQINDEKTLEYFQ